MKAIIIGVVGLLGICCTGKSEQVPVDTSKHVGLVTLESEHPFQVLYSEGHLPETKKRAALVAEAYTYLSQIMGDKKDFYVLVLSQNDWANNAYSPAPGMPEYYKGNLITGAGTNALADDYADLLASFPKEHTEKIYQVYGNDAGELDMRLFFDKLAIHELTHNFQDPKNGEGYSISRWLEEVHANMGLYAFYKEKRPEELKYILTLVDFSCSNPPPDLQYTSLEDFDTHYFDIEPANYGQYQMRFTQAAQHIIDSLGADILKPLNDFIIQYDESTKEKYSTAEFHALLADKVHPYFADFVDTW